jgi:hypothetical protein
MTLDLIEDHYRPWRHRAGELGAAGAGVVTVLFIPKAQAVGSFPVAEIVASAARYN